MDIRRLKELEWHCGILQGKNEQKKALIDNYITPLVEHLLGGFGNYLKHDFTLAHEAAWTAFQHYFRHPRSYQPHRGSLRYYLELQAVKSIQQLLHEENRNWHFQQMHFVLARYFDNEQDLRIAKLLIRNENNWCEFARILDTGALRIEMQLREIRRNLVRIRKKLAAAPVDFASMANKRLMRGNKPRSMREALA